MPEISMPKAAQSPCRQLGCRALVERPGYCDQHRRAAYSRYHAGSSRHQENNRFYASARWRKVRRRHLDQEPLCRHCLRAGKWVEAIIVDHIRERSHGGEDYDDANLQSLCKSCHDAKSGHGVAAGRIKGCLMSGMPIDPNHHWNLSSQGRGRGA